MEEHSKEFIMRIENKNCKNGVVSGEIRFSTHEDIVRCKDCARYIPSLDGMCNATLMKRKPDDFCSRGERRE